MTTSTFNSVDARLKLRDILDGLTNSDNEVIIERYNKPSAVVINYDRWQAIKRQLQEAMLAQAKQISADIANGKIGTTSHEDLMRLMIEKRASHVVD